MSVESPALQVRYLLSGWQVLVEVAALARGSRSTCIAFYDHEKTRGHAPTGAGRTRRPAGRRSLTRAAQLYVVPTVSPKPLRHARFELRQGLGARLSGKRAPPARLFPGGYGHESGGTRARYWPTTTSALFRSPARVEDGGAFNPGAVASRTSRLVDCWLQSPAAHHDRSPTRAAHRHVSIVAYVHAGDDFMPLVPMLGGHPNFLADVKGVPPAMSFFFPDHPKAQAWADMWEKCVALVTPATTRVPPSKHGMPMAAAGQKIWARMSGPFCGRLCAQIFC